MELQLGREYSYIAVTVRHLLRRVCVAARSWRVVQAFLDLELICRNASRDGFYIHMKQQVKLQFLNFF
jgi:CTP-dependent riboflavin kinase